MMQLWLRTPNTIFKKLICQYNHACKEFGLAINIWNKRHGSRCFCIFNIQHRWRPRSIHIFGLYYHHQPMAWHGNWQTHRQNEQECIEQQSVDLAQQAKVIPGMCPLYSALRQRNLNNLHQAWKNPGKLLSPLPMMYPRYHMERESYQHFCIGASKLLRHASSSFLKSSLMSRSRTSYEWRTYTKIQFFSIFLYK